MYSGGVIAGGLFSSGFWYGVGGCVVGGEEEEEWSMVFDATVRSGPEGLLGGK